MNLNETFFPDHFTQVDRRTVYVSLLFSVASLLALWLVRPVSINQNKKQIAKLESISNKVRYKGAGSVSFYDIGKDEFLQNNDEVYTGVESNAWVRFKKSNVLLKIPASSLVRIEETENGDTVEVKEGVVDIYLGNDKKINLKVNGIDHLITTTGGEGNLKAYYAAGELHFFTKSNGIKITNDNGTTALDSNKDFILKSEKILNSSEFEVLSPQPGEKIDASNDFRILTNKDDFYKITISKNADMSSVLDKFQFNGRTGILNPSLQEGEYYLNIESKSSSKTIPINIVSSLRIDGLLPGDGEMLNLQPGDNVELRWNPIPVKKYKVTVKELLKKEKSYVVSENKLNLKEIKGASFEWSVSPEIATGKFSNVQRLNQAGLRFNGKIEFKNLPIRPVLNVEDIKYRFNWNNVKSGDYIVKVSDESSGSELVNKTIKENSFEMKLLSIGSYKLEIASEDFPSLKKAIYSFDVEKPVATWKQDLKKEIKSTEDSEIVSLGISSNLEVKNNLIAEVTFKSNGSEVSKKEIGLESLSSFRLEKFGDYCFKVKSKIKRKYYSDGIDHCLKFIQIPVFAKLPKASDAVLEYIKHKGLDSYKIVVPEIEKAKQYQFQIYKDTKLKELVYTVDTNAPEMFWTSNRSGVYYLRYKVFDQKNRSSEFSGLSKLIFPISPLSDW
jgi:hypothetical protein